MSIKVDCELSTVKNSGWGGPTSRYSWRFLHFRTQDTVFLQIRTLFSGQDTFCSQTALAACIHAHLIREHRTLLSDACQDTCASLCINSLLVQTATALYRVPMHQFPTR